MGLSAAAETPTKAPGEPLFLLESVMERPLQVEAFGLQVALFSSSRPDREGPNEDAAAVLPLDEHTGLLAVADGVGGRVAGADASRTALESLREAVDDARRSGSALREAILDAIERANAQLLSRGDGAAATLVVLEVAGTTVRPYHLGDAEALICGQRGRLKHRTVAHTPAGFGWEAGLLDEGEALRHEDRHLVSNVLGDAEMRIEIGPPLDLAPRDTVVLGSDGLFDNLTEEELVETVRKGPLVRSARHLLERTARRMRPEDATALHKPDDLTFLLARRLRSAA